MVDILQVVGVESPAKVVDTREVAVEAIQAEAVAILVESLAKVVAILVAIQAREVATQVVAVVDILGVGEAARQVVVVDTLEVVPAEDIQVVVVVVVDTPEVTPSIINHASGNGCATSKWKRE